VEFRLSPQYWTMRGTRYENLAQRFVSFIAFVGAFAWLT
jgi:type IV secretory pathway TrbL component